ncbi:arylsulfatase [Sphingosinicella sp. LY1275]|uniref:arylsulfatase n=1 Tax=Sphingosinicella sp. LY1275 TaxID=3095379 RepID=UPI002ADEDBF2|nr:arylsulfatase [Sphingosinicella sp. LY1275]MEA1013000.1 arylsulfatase [Sphingosinicella sp. LY1275]
MSATAPEAKRPNVLLIVVDDMGYSDCQPFGGEIRTPVLAALADEGVRLRNFHVSSLCAPTRSMLLSGVDNHQNGLGTMPPMHSTNQYMQPGYEGPLNHRVMTIAEVLKGEGYRTYMAGKWHLGAIDGYRPEDRGFERVFSFLGGGASHFDDHRALSANEVPHTRYDEDGKDVTDDLPDDFYSSDYYADKMISYLAGQGDDAPFFAYLAFTAPHDPLQVPDKWLDVCRGAYDSGYDAIRRRRLSRMQEMGLIPEALADNPGSGLFPAWDALDEQERAEQARKMEIYAAMIENADHNIGRVFALLTEQGQYDDTIVIFMSDNGANPKEPYFYAPNTPEMIERKYDNSLENMGRKGSFVSIGGAWAEVANTPFSYFKTTTYEGGTQVPLIVAGPGIVKRGIDTSQLLHATDLLPTILDFIGIERPAERQGQALAPIYGKSWKPYLSGESLAPVRGPLDALGFEMVECRAIIKGDWKLIFMAPPYGENDWHLFNLHHDPREMTNLASAEPEKFDELRSEWDAYAAAVGYIEAGEIKQLEGMSADEFFRYTGLS